MSNNKYLDSFKSSKAQGFRNFSHKTTAKKKVHRMRRRMPKSGMLVQMDSSFHNWLPHIKENLDEN
jgi:hypothetical protein